MAIRDPQKMMKFLYTIGFLIILVIAVVLLNQARHTRAFTLATTHQPERLTELYFTHPSSLPTTGKAGQNLPVDFTIHNLEAENMSYTYRIELIDQDGNGTVLAQRQLSIKNGNAAQISDTVSLPPANGRSQVDIQLIGQPETIHFWLGVQP
jgi:hypothetical protein